MVGEQRCGTAPEYGMPGSVQSERILFTAARKHAAAIDYVYDFGDNEINSWLAEIKL